MIKNSVSFWFWWTRALREWFEDKLSHIVFDKSDLAKQGPNPEATNSAILAAFGNIDFSTLAKEAQATANKEEILAAIPTECSDADIDHMFETTTEDGLIIVPSELITPEGTMPISVFKAITGLTPTE